MLEALKKLIASKEQGPDVEVKIEADGADQSGDKAAANAPMLAHKLVPENGDAAMDDKDAMIDAMASEEAEEEQMGSENSPMHQKMVEALADSKGSGGNRLRMMAADKAKSKLASMKTKGM